MMFYPDISRYAPVDNWKEIKDNVGFIISKATEGVTYIDPTLPSFIKGCEENDIPYWLYAYLRRGNELAQAKFLVKFCGRAVGKNFQGYVLDIEENNREANCISALEWLKTQSEKTMVYVGWSDRSQYANLLKDRGENCAWWEARYRYDEGDPRDDGKYSEKNPPHDGVDLHQYTANGHCPGIDGNCDLNRLTGAKPLSWFTGRDAEDVKEERIILPQRCYFMVGDGYEQLKSAKPEIKKVQELCNDLINTGLKVDGKYGEKTENAVKKLQNVVGVKVDGLFGEKTLKAAEKFKEEK